MMRAILLILISAAGILLLQLRLAKTAEPIALPSIDPVASVNSNPSVWRWHPPKTPYIGNKNIFNFPIAKKVIFQIQSAHPRTIYCDCQYQEKTILIDTCGYQPQRDEARARRLEWEHVVPAENFGRSFQEWRDGSRLCTKGDHPYKGRKCAELNPKFNQIEGDLYNLWPEDGELNGLRNDFSMAELTSSEYDFGRCQAKIQDRKFEPEPKARGTVARVYFYMEGAYPGHGILSDKNIKLFEAWDHQFPVNEWECRRTRIIEDVQGNENPIVKPRCLESGLWPKTLSRKEKITPPRFSARPELSRRSRNSREW